MALSLDALWNFLLNMDILGFVQAIFIGTVGELFYGILALTLLLIVYGRTKSITYVAIIWVFLGTLLLPMIPAAGWGIGAVLLYLSLGGVVAYLFLRTIR